MASIKEKLDKNGNVVYQVQASNGRGRRVWRTFRQEPTWSKRTVQRELQRFAAELESQLEDGAVLYAGCSHRRTARNRCTQTRRPAISSASAKGTG